MSIKTVYNYNITIVATSTSTTMLDSEISNAIEYGVYQLAAPTNVSMTDTNILSWDQSLHATGYNISIDDIVVAQTTSGSTLNYDLRDILASYAGISTIRVDAISSAVNWLTSVSTEWITNRTSREKTYNILLDGVNYDEIQLPFSVHRVVGETLDTATINIGYISRSTPWEPLTNAVIYFYEDGTTARQYNMVVESDNVVEVQYNGTSSLYTHKLSLVENTLLLQNVIEPNFTITQDPVIEYNKSKIVHSTDSTISTRYSSDIADMDKSEEWTVDISWSLFDTNYYTIGTNKNLVGNIHKYYKKDANISLPKVSDTIKFYRVGADIPNTTSVLVPVRYYYRKHTADPEYNSSYPEKEISQNSSGDQHGSGNIYFSGSNEFPFSISTAGTYDIIVVWPAYNLNYLIASGKVKPSSVGIHGIGPEYANQFPSAVYPAKNATTGEKMLARTVYSGIEIIDSSSSYIQQKISVAEALVKAVYINTPISKTTAKYKKSTYVIDQNILALTANLACPDLTISNGKYLYDTLLLLGKEFNGIPRLEADNHTITYDILSTTSEYDINPNSFSATTELTVASSELNTYSSGYISTLSNMVSDTAYTVYPAPGMYTACRADNSDSGIVSLSTMAITVDQPIYKIKSVSANFTGADGKPYPINITDYVVETTVYDSLLNTNTGKGCHISYSQGDNMIVGLGQLSEESELYAMLGWASDKYVIENIIEDALLATDSSTDIAAVMGSGAKKLKPMDIVYNVEYYPYINTTSYIENDSRPTLAHSIYKQLNQEDNVISDTRMGNSALTQLHRLGNNTIAATYLADTIAYVPLLGYHTTIDNDIYYIDEATYSYNAKYISTTVNYNQNYNKITPRASIGSEYRQYQLTNENTVDRTVNFNEYCYISHSDLRYTLPTWDKISMGNTWNDAIIRSFWYNGKKPVEKMNL